MPTRTLKQIGRIFKEFGDKIENGTCGVDIETLNDIANKMIHIKLYQEDMCKFLNCSRATLKRNISSGKIPKPYKEAGYKEFWYRDEVEEHLSKVEI